MKIKEKRKFKFNGKNYEYTHYVSIWSYRDAMRTKKECSHHFKDVRIHKEKMQKGEKQIYSLYILR